MKRLGRIVLQHCRDISRWHDTHGRKRGVSRRIQRAGKTAVRALSPCMDDGNSGSTPITDSIRSGVMCPDAGASAARRRAKIKQSFNSMPTAHGPPSSTSATASPVPHARAWRRSGRSGRSDWPMARRCRTSHSRRPRLRVGAQEAERQGVRRHSNTDCLFARPSRHTARPVRVSLRTQRQRSGPEGRPIPRLRREYPAPQRSR